MLVASLRDVIHNQSQEIEKLQKQLKEASSSNGDEVRLERLCLYLFTTHSFVLASCPESTSGYLVFGAPDIRRQAERYREGTGGFTGPVGRGHQ
jgi:hypothetical protein